MYSKPDFICIGPQKTGTTWLYEMLDKSDDVDLPAYKEIRYFWEVYQFGEISLKDKLKKPHWHFKHLRNSFKNRMKRHIRNAFTFQLQYDSFRQDISYYLKKHSDDWYADLFSKMKVSGDFSPQYALLPESEIIKIHQRFPNMKIILGIRNPVDRIWSAAKMVVAQKKDLKLSDIKKDTFSKFIDSYYDNEGNDYTKIIQNWSNIFGEEQFFYYYFDDFKISQQEVLNNICEFLNVSKINLTEKPKIIRKGLVDSGIPDQIKIRLIEMNKAYVDQLVDLTDDFWPKKWINEYEQFLQTTGVNHDTNI